MTIRNGKSKLSERLRLLERRAATADQSELRQLEDKLRNMTTEELHQYSKEVLAEIEPDPRWAEMTPEQLHAEARRLVQEGQQQARLFN